MLQLSAKGKDRSAAESRAPQRPKPKRTIEFHRIGAAEEMDADDTGGPEIVKIAFHQAPAYSHSPITRVDVDVEMSGIVCLNRAPQLTGKTSLCFRAETKRAPAKSMSTGGMAISAKGNLHQQRQCHPPRFCASKFS